MPEKKKKKKLPRAARVIYQELSEHRKRLARLEGERERKPKAKRRRTLFERMFGDGEE
jgi:hypothetical protein